MKLEGKVAIVTGSGQGIGQGIVHCLAKEGADVVVVDINGANAKKVSGEVKTLGRQSLAIKADITDSKQVAQLVQDTIDTFGKIDILVNGVGGFGKTFWARTSLRFIDQKETEWDESYELNFKTQFLMCRAVVPYFLKQKSGKIVNMSSIGGKRPNPKTMAYGVFKASVIHFTRILALELAEHNINVNCVCPGYVYTSLWEKLAAQFIRLTPDAKGMKPRDYFLRFIESSPQKRGETIEDIGHAVVFLVSEDAKNITGQSLNVDGGRVMN